MYKTLLVAASESRGVFMWRKDGWMFGKIMLNLSCFVNLIKGRWILQSSASNQELPVSVFVGNFHESSIWKEFWECLWWSKGHINNLLDCGTVDCARVLAGTSVYFGRRGSWKVLVCNANSWIWGNLWAPPR